MKQSLLSNFGLAPKPKQEGPRYGDFFERAVAAALDMLILFTLLNSLFHAVTVQLYTLVDQEKFAAANAAESVAQTMRLLWESRLIPIGLCNALFQFIMLGIVIVGTQCAFYTTPGKWILGLEIRRADTLERPERWRFAVRYVGLMLAGAPLLIGLIWISFNKQRRGWHDLLAGTVVLQTRPEGWYWAKIKALFRLIFGKKPVGEPPAE